LDMTWIDQAIAQAMERADGILTEVDDFPHITERKRWVCTPDGVWTGGFWAGILWLCYEQQRTDERLQRAISFTDRLLVRANDTHNHDLGFMFYPSAIKAWQLTGEERYRNAARQAATALAAQFNADAGYIPGWGFFGGRDWSGSVLVDTLMNLPLLVWATRQGGDAHLMEVVRRQVSITLKHHMRADGSFYHVYKFDPKSGAPLGGDTYQGLGAESIWSRGQAWAITALAILSEMTEERSYLEAGEKVAARFDHLLPETHIPPWDFAAPGADQPRDSSAAAIASYGFLKLAKVTRDPQHQRTAEKILKSLVETCGNRTGSGGLLLHATADLPHGLGIDESTMYGDFYYLKSLVSLRRSS
jgi:unsaturated chondroitin disaccharide hydrolase